MLSTFAAWRRRRETVREMSRLSDRQLADIGFARSDIAGAARLAPEISRDATGMLVHPRRRPARFGADPIFDESFDSAALPSRA